MQSMETAVSEIWMIQVLIELRDDLVDITMRDNVEKGVTSSYMTGELEKGAEKSREG